MAQLLHPHGPRRCKLCPHAPYVHVAWPWAHSTRVMQARIPGCSELCVLYAHIVFATERP